MTKNQTRPLWGSGAGSSTDRILWAQQTYPRWGVSARHQTASEARLRRLSAQLHSLGPRPLYEFLKEIDGGADLCSRLEAYAALEPYVPFIRAHDGDRLPSLRGVGGHP
jgi:hypothetical protein